MAKPSDIRSRLGAPTPQSAANMISLNKPAHKIVDDHKNTAPKPQAGPTKQGSGRAQGGAGQASVRPKV
ncbi:MAG: hypothetical protein DYG92_10540 [Leptolyngbya sp. PLA1]|nr:hypothetical protein [Leptolyngbya sp. PLA1]